MAKTKVVVSVIFDTDDSEYNNERMDSLVSELRSHKINWGSGYKGDPEYPETTRNYIGKQDKTNQKIIRIAKKHGAKIERSGGIEKEKPKRTVGRTMTGSSRRRLTRRRRNAGPSQDSQHFEMKRKFRMFAQYVCEKMQEGIEYNNDGDLDDEWFEEILEQAGDIVDRFDG